MADDGQKKKKGIPIPEIARRCSKYIKLDKSQIKTTIDTLRHIYNVLSINGETPDETIARIESLGVKLTKEQKQTIENNYTSSQLAKVVKKNEKGSFLFSRQCFNHCLHFLENL
jgi:hypothetical protein